MKVKELMTQEVMTVTPEDKLDRVFFLFNFENIRHVPVMENGHLVASFPTATLKKCWVRKKNFSSGLTGRRSLSPLGRCGPL